MDLTAWFLLLITCVDSIDFTDKLITSYREKVRRMFYHAYNGYLDNAFPLDELKPISCVGQDTWGSFSLSLVDALDTLLVMGNHTEFVRAVDLVVKSVRTDANVNVSVFETNIRVVGGLLSAHMLSGRVKDLELEPGWPCSGPLLRLAEKMAARLLPAFNTDTGMPYGTVNLRYGVHKSETPITCTAGVGTFIVEFGALSRLVGDPQYERVALKALESLWNTRSPIGLVGNHINVQTGQWTATDSGIGAGVDSYFEYLVKGALLFQRPALMKQFHEYASSINRYVRKEDWFMWVSMQKGAVSLPIFQSLEAFWPGLLTMVGDLEDASRIMLQYSQTIRQYGFPPEFYNIPNAQPHEKRAAFPLRPEMAESLMYLYRATEDPTFLEIGAQLIDAIESSAKTRCGYATVNNVNEHSIEDRMESFFLAETTKYLYLLFDPQNFLHNDGTHAKIVDTPNGECVIEAGGYIYNTEAHPIDPAIVHCCSEQRQAERETIRKWESEVDFVALLHNNGMGPFVNRDSLLDSMHEDEKMSKESEYMEKQYGSSDIEYEVDPSFSSTEAEADQSEVSQPDEQQATPPLGEDNLVTPPLEGDNLATPPPTPQPAVTSSEEQEKATEEPATGIDREEVVEQVRALIRKSRLIDEEKRGRGEKSEVAEKLIANLVKMYKEYEDLVWKAKELDDLEAEEIKLLLEKRELVESIPVAEADCQSCCYRMDFIGDSVAMRIFMDTVHRNYIYPNNQIPFDFGPVCRLRDAPRTEDNYNNVAPPVSSASLPGDVPQSVFYHPSSFVNFDFEDISHLGFDLLSSPPLSFMYKFTGMGQVSPRRNSSWYFN